MVLNEPQYVMTYKLYFSNNDTYMIVDILDYSNITLAWGLQSPLDITWISQTSQISNYSSLGHSNNNLTKQALILTNNSVMPFMKDNFATLRPNKTINQTSQLSLVVLALSDKQ